ncbi:MAG: hypothetical protein LBO73_04250 [Holosporaceae bacterium]|jgi:hypothetical protein|nr:hypothetical protein [Holosporaceae bacterium]
MKKVLLLTAAVTLPCQADVLSSIGSVLEIGAGVMNMLSGNNPAQQQAMAAEAAAMQAAALAEAAEQADAAEAAKANALRAQRTDLANQISSLSRLIKKVRQSGIVTNTTAISYVDMTLSELETARSSLLGDDNTVRASNRSISQAMVAATEYLEAVIGDTTLEAAKSKLDKLSMETDTFLRMHYGLTAVASSDNFLTPVHVNDVVAATTIGTTTTAGTTAGTAVGTTAGTAVGTTVGTAVGTVGTAVSTTTAARAKLRR